MSKAERLREMQEEINNLKIQLEQKDKEISELKMKLYRRGTTIGDSVHKGG